MRPFLVSGLKSLFIVGCVQSVMSKFKRLVCLLCAVFGGFRHWLREYKNDSELVLSKLVSCFVATRNRHRWYSRSKRTANRHRWYSRSKRTANRHRWYSRSKRTANNTTGAALLYLLQQKRPINKRTRAIDRQRGCVAGLGSNSARTMKQASRRQWRPAILHEKRKRKRETHPATSSSGLFPLSIRAA